MSGTALAVPARLRMARMGSVIDVAARFFPDLHVASSQ